MSLQKLFNNWSLLIFNLCFTVGFVFLVTSIFPCYFPDRMDQNSCSTLFLVAAFNVYIVILFILSKTASSYHQKDLDLATQDKAFIGNRSISYWITALSAHASDMSDWLFLAFPAQIFLYGNQSYIIALALVLGMWATWHFVAIPLRTQSEKYQAISLVDYLEKHFKAENLPLRIIATCIILFFFIMYLAAGLKGIGFISQSTFGISYAVGTGIGALITLIIALNGGFVAAAWTDCFQALFLLGVIVFVPAFLLGTHVSFDMILQNANARSLSLFPTTNISWNTLLNNAAWGLGYFGMPHILTKLLASENAHDLKKAKYIGLAWQVTALTGALAVGLVAIGYLPLAISQPEHVFISMVLKNFHPFLAGLMLCGVLAATISTMLAQLIVTATTFTHDVYHKLIAPEAPSQTTHRLFSLSLLFFMIFAYCIAYPQNISIFSLVQYAWSGLGSSFGPLVLLSLCSYRISSHAAVAGLVGGAVGSGLWRFLQGDILWLGYSVTEMIPGYISAFICIGIVLLYQSLQSKQ